jgi:hypothetical protein
MIRPESFGARADSEHDDAAAIQAAIDKAREHSPASVWFAPGAAYRVGKTLSLASRVTLTSDAATPATLRATRVDALSQLVASTSTTDLIQRLSTSGKRHEELLSLLRALSAPIMNQIREWFDRDGRGVAQKYEYDRSMTARKISPSWIMVFLIFLSIIFLSVTIP